MQKYIYDVFGDTINTAARMENYSEPMRINISQATHRLIKEWAFDVEQAMPFRAKKKSRWGWGYGLFLTWNDLDLRGKEVRLVITFERADGFQKINRMMVAPHEKVLTVVHHIAGLAIDEGICAATQMSASLEHQDFESLFAQTHGSGQARKPAPNYHNTGFHNLGVTAFSACS